MNNQQSAHQSELIYRLGDKPPFLESLFASLQHVMACFIGIGLPPLIVALSLGFPPDMIAYLVAMSLFASGLSTFIQCRKFGPVGSGLLAVQGTSFAFLQTVIASGGILITLQNVPPEEVDYGAVWAGLMGVCFAGSFIQITLSRFIPQLQKVISPLVSGVIVTLIGVSLLNVSLKDIGGGNATYNKFLSDPSAPFGHWIYIGLAAITTLSIVLLNKSERRFMRIGSIVFGLIIGTVIASLVPASLSPTGQALVSFDKFQNATLFALPIPFRYGFFTFNLSIFIPIAFLYLLTVVQTYGDLTAVSMVSEEPTEGPIYLERIAAGELGDGVNSCLASIFNSLPNTTFSQNTGVLQLTGVASRKIGMFVAVILMIFGFFPKVGSLFQIVPAPVLGGATLIMFATVAVSGIRIITSHLENRRGLIILAVSLGMGFGTMMVPGLFNKIEIQILRIMLDNPVILGGMIAMVLNIMLPQKLRNNPPKV